MNIRALRISLLLLLGALPPRVHAEWFILEWMEKPASRGSSTLANVGIFDHHCQVSVFEKSVRDLIESFHEEDFKACLPSPLAVCDDIPLFEVLLDGLPAMTDENGLRLLSSWSFRGPNVAEHLDPLRNHSWDVYRLNHWEQIKPAFTNSSAWSANELKNGTATISPEYLDCGTPIFAPRRRRKSVMATPVRRSLWPRCRMPALNWMPINDMGCLLRNLEDVDSSKALQESKITLELSFLFVEK
jgi:hypothetical protein